jgi:hypothetical protein
MLEDEGTLLVMREYIAGLQANPEDLDERKDVVNYRVSTFLPRIKALEPYMATWIEYPLPASSLDGSGDSEVPS